MPLRRDDEAMARLRLRPENQDVRDAVEPTSAHGDLGQLVFDHAKRCGDLRVLPVATASYPALVARCTRSTRR